jgi:hypothetical protein
LPIVPRGLIGAQRPFKYHRFPENMLQTKLETTGEELVGLFREMTRYRRLEVRAYSWLAS